MGKVDRRSGPDLNDESLLLDYVNRALRYFQVVCDPGGFLPDSSSERALAHKFPELTTTDVRILNEALLKLGVRDSQSVEGGGEHHIRLDVYPVTAEELRARRPLPLRLDATVTSGSQELADQTNQVLAALREKATRLQTRQDVGQISTEDYNAVVGSVPNADIADRIQRLMRELALTRVYPVQDGASELYFVDFDATVKPQDVSLSRRLPLKRWPHNVRDLISVSEVVDSQGGTPLDTVSRLVTLCKQLKEEAAAARLDADTQRGKAQAVEGRLSGLMDLVKRLGTEKTELANANQALEAEVAALQQRLHEAEERLTVLTTPDAATSQAMAEADELLRQYGV